MYKYVDYQLIIKYMKQKKLFVEIEVMQFASEDFE